MAPNDILPDGTSNFSGGQNAAIAPHSLQPNQFALAVNMTTATESLGPRWGIHQDDLDFSDVGEYTLPETGKKTSFEIIYRRAKFQAFIPYSIGVDFYNIIIASGFIFLVNLQTFKVTVLNPVDQVNPYADRINWSNAGNYLTIFDFPNVPFILQGINIDRSDLSLGQVPVSVMGTYNQNRLCIANAGHDWTAGDPAGSQAAPMAPITFLEIEIPSSPYVGDVYQLTTNYGNDPITAMGFLQVVDTSTGIGPLLVSTPRAIYSYRTDLPRSQWQGGSAGFVFGSVLLYSDGIVGQRAHTNVNGDLMFLASDGQVRSLSMARNEQQKWSNTPISREVSNFLIYNDLELAQYSAIAYFKNKVFITCTPFRTDSILADGTPQTDFAFGGVVVLEMDNNAGITKENPPCWAGMWTGTYFMDFAVNNKTMYIMGKQNGENVMYHFTPETTVDFIDGEERLIQSILETKEYDNRDGTVNKELITADFGFRNIQDKVSFDVDYKTNTIGNFIPWRKDVVFNAPYKQCQGLPQFANGLSAQGIRDLNIGGVNQDNCEGGQRTAVYKGLQLRLFITGRYWELEYIRIFGKQLPPITQEIYCKENEGIPVENKCFNPWFIPEKEC